MTLYLVTYAASTRVGSHCRYATSADRELNFTGRSGDRTHTLPASVQAEYTYNWRGHQVVRKVHTSPSTSETTITLHDFDGRRLIEFDYDEATQTQTFLRQYIWLDDHPLAIYENGQFYYVHWDHIDRPVMVTDDQANVVWDVEYYAFGGIRQVNVDTGAITPGLRFPGQWFQTETGLHQNWHRDYDPTLGRYLQADPLGLIDGPSVYGYAKQSPVRYTDPTGLFSISRMNPNPEPPANPDTCVEEVGFIRECLKAICVVLGFSGAGDMSDSPSDPSRGGRRNEGPRIEIVRRPDDK